MAKIMTILFMLLLLCCGKEQQTKHIEKRQEEFAPCQDSFDIELLLGCQVRQVEEELTQTKHIEEK